MILKIAPPRIKSAETPREKIATDFKSTQSELPISGGWGYSKEDAVVIDKNESTVSGDMPFDGVGIEYVFVEKRIYEELIVFRPKEDRYFGIEWNLLLQKSVRDDNKSYDVLSFEVTAFPNSVWQKVQVDLENHYKPQVSDIEIKTILKEYGENQIKYTTEYWFDITSFYGHKKSSSVTKESWIDRIIRWADKNGIPENGFSRDRNKICELLTFWGDRGNLLDLPPEIGQLKNLKLISLCGNKLSEIPSEIGQLNNLNSLWLSHNNLSSLPIEVGLLTKLDSLYVDDNNLASLPIEVGLLTKLDSLGVSDNNLTIFPEISGLICLEFLDLGNNGITEIPSRIGELSAIKDLMLNGNKLTGIPSEICELENLKILILSQNNLYILPPAIWKLSTLESLYVDGNNLSRLERNIFRLLNLRVLNVSANNLDYLPPEIRYLQCLEELSIDQNNFTELPEVICTIKTLKKIDGIEKLQNESTKGLIERCGYTLV